ncbi:DUF2470 domain-containing protein [Streptomyces sp. H10-C2]|uniref:DUF2470 domain-containing protein n=1 Tax=unclassified Streptomyces TaxID=2593676 RepID=UPI0024BBE5A5|nr:MULTISPECIES: DUF2470 domain-containing protein [unclassified Streptomyces]MDJ0345273.1 DUF2470 domain-containing protein [Streptomyces sp. PH10-H1]MDJ0370724.1 DUF2470 domain-containing protein [Streptomyces sp. H10-C2]
MPSAAERARTLVEGNPSAVLVIPGLDAGPPGQMVPEMRSVGPGGDVFLLFPADSPAVRAATHAEADELAAVLEITDVAPVSVPHRIRGRAWIAGWLTPVRDEPVVPGTALLRLEVGEASVDDLWGAEQVEPDDFATATADPLAAHEADLLQHLAAAHEDQVGWLCGLVGGYGGRDGECGGECDGARTAVPVALDRFGLRVRFTGAGGTFDARFDFPEPLRGHEELHRAMHTLFDAARGCADDLHGA